MVGDYVVVDPSGRAHRPTSWSLIERRAKRRAPIVCKCGGVMKQTSDLPIETISFIFVTYVCSCGHSVEKHIDKRREQ